MAAIGETVFGTLAQIRGVSYVESAALVSVDGGAPDYDDPDRGVSFLTSSAIALAITAPSAQEQHLHPADLAVNLRVPTIAATTCDENATRDIPALLLTRRNNVSIYGPAAAHTHASWVGAGGVTSPNGSGVFAVSGAGSLTLTLSVGYDDLLAAVPPMTAPVGPPDCYMIHRANHWYPAYGPNEAAYDWRGWERLCWTFLAPSVCTLTVTVAYRTFTHDDNHGTDSTRSTEYVATPSEHTATFSVPVLAGQAVNPMTLIEGTAYAKMERVVSITLSGFANGAWQFTDDPRLTWANVGVLAKPVQIWLKTFEGWQRSYYDAGNEVYVYQYHHGGASIHADGAFLWYDADEDNGGHWNFVEWTLRNFDYRHSSGEGAADLTVAYSLVAWATFLAAISEVFDASVDTAAVAAALTDGEDPANTLTTLRSFDVRDTSPGYNATEETHTEKLEQDVSAGVANCGIPCASWTIAAGIKYTFMSDETKDGLAHGRAMTGTSLLRNTVGITHIWRSPPDTPRVWTDLGTVDADAYGHWVSPSLREVATYEGTVPDDVQRYVYGYGPNALDVTEFGEAYTREYVVETLKAAGFDIDSVLDAHGIGWICYGRNGIQVRTVNGPRLPWGAEVPVSGASGSYSYPRIRAADDGSLTVTAFDNTAQVTVQWKSLDRGRHWSPI